MTGLAGTSAAIGANGRRLGRDGVLGEFDLAEVSVRELNAALHAADAPQRVVVRNPGGRHNLAVGLDGPVWVEIAGHTGYYCAGCNQQADVRIAGNCGVGVAENMMSGRVEVGCNASQAAGSSAHGGMLVVHGDAAARCGISLKGADIIVRGSVGHMAGFMAQSGRLVVCGDAGEAFGDSIYEMRAYVRGAVVSVGADCVEKELRDEHRAELAELLAAAGLDDVEAADFRRYGSARTLYHFRSDHAADY
jgi:glutamate synthase domain-containing protein 3